SLPSVSNQSSSRLERPHVHFSPLRWASTGVVRISYRLWTRIAVRIFPENSQSERIAHALHIPLPDKLNMSWVTDHLAVGGRVLIHCEHGVGRSVLLTCAVLVYEGMHAHDALQLIQRKRWQAAPNHRQISRLKEFESALAARRSA